MNRILVIAVHPDDEALGCGGALLKHKAAGDEIFWVIVTDMTEKSGFSKKQIAEREKEIAAVTKSFGFDGVHRFHFATLKLDEVPIGKIIDKISRVFKKVKPDIVYLPFRSDVHSDHRVVFDAAFSCTKNFRFPSITKILMMETISETEFSPSLSEVAFIPNYFVDVSDFLKKKLDIVKTYKSEIKKHPFPRSLKNIKALATFRGANAGCKYAEGFVVLKEVQ